MGQVPQNTRLPDAPPPTEPPATSDQTTYPFPEPGKWPCQSVPLPLPAAQQTPTLVNFLYRLLRDGAQAPGDVENHAIQARRGEELAVFTNPHLEQYARSLAAYLLPRSAGDVPE